MEQETISICSVFLQRLNGYLSPKRPYLSPKLQKEFEILREKILWMMALLETDELPYPFLNINLAEGDIEQPYVLKARKLVYDVEDEVDKIMAVRPTSWFSYTISSFFDYSIANHLDRIQSLLDVMEDINSNARSSRGMKSNDDRAKSELANTPRSLILEEPQAVGPSMIPTNNAEAGFDETENKLLMLLVGHVDDELQHQQLRIINVTGMTGRGKTFLVRKLWNERADVMKQFHCRAWISDASWLEPKTILALMLEGFCFGTTPFAVDGKDLESLVQAINSYLTGKRFLLVLDDVWDINVWNLVVPALPQDCGGRVILTSRKTNLLNIGCDIIHVERLEHEQAWSLFCNIAFQFSNDPGCCPARLYNTANAIVRECDGVPLSIMTIAAKLSDPLMDNHPNSWEIFLKKFQKHQPNLALNGDLSKRIGRAGVALLLSYNALDPELKYFLLYCCFLPGNREIHVKKLIRLYVAEGLMKDAGEGTAEEIVRTYFKQLIDLKLVIAERTGSTGSIESCRVSETLRDLAPRIVHRAKFRNFFGYTKGRSIHLEEVRRLSITGNSSSIPSCGDEVAFVRSCFLYDIDNSQTSSICQLLAGGLKLLRVLDIKGMKIQENMLHHFAHLIHLSYLGLRATSIARLPASFSNLRDIETIDIRDTSVTSLPVAMTRHGKFRHILLSGFFRRRVVHFPWGKKNQIPEYLQTLAGVKASISIIEALGYCTRLQKLSIGGVKPEYLPKLRDAIKNMPNLHSLTLKTYRVERLQLEELSCTENLRLETLKIGGPIHSLQDLVSCISSSLTRLYLWDSILDVDPFLCLHQLSSLVILSLSNAYAGEQIVCKRGWYCKLKKLSILRTRRLKSWIIEEEAMQRLESLFVGYCPNMKAVPDNLDCLSALKVVHASQMPQEFILALQQRNQDGFKVHVVPQFVHFE